MFCNRPVIFPLNTIVADTTCSVVKLSSDKSPGGACREARYATCKFLHRAKAKSAITSLLLPSLFSCHE